METNAGRVASCVAWVYKVLFAPKRRILEILFLNCRFDRATLCPEMRKPLDMLAEGLISNNGRGSDMPLSSWLRSLPFHDFAA